MIIVIGKSGQLARELASAAPDTTVCLGRDDIDITDAESIKATLQQYKASAIINASAYTAVDKAEEEQAQAFLINDTAVSLLGEYCAAQNLHLVQVSTDYVFNGQHHSPIEVNALRDPIGIYGASKAAGEQALESIQGLSYTLIRTAWVYSRFGNNFVHTMLRLMKEKPQLGVIADQVGTPTCAAGLAQACLFAAHHAVQGNHHWTDQGVASWYDFAVAIQRLAIAKGLLDKAVPVSPITTADYPTQAQRPAYSVLSKSTLKTAFADVEQKHWEARLASMLDTLN